MQKLQDRFKEIRKINNKTASEMAEILGMSRQALNKIETGKNGISDNIKLKLFETFKINLHWLVTGIGGMFFTEKEFLNEKESILINNYRKIDSKLQDTLISISEVYLKDNK